jgi:drug/metabolite transporter (DMT)-like permease
MTAASLRSTVRTTIFPWRYHLLLLLGAFTGGWASILGRMAQGEGVPTVYIIAFRQLMSALILTPFVFHYYQAELRGLGRREILFAAIAGFWFSIHLLAGFEGLKHTSVLVNMVLGGTTPLWIALIEVSLLKHRLSRWVWIGLMFTLGGSIIIAIGGSNSGLGDNPGLGSLLSIGAALTGSLYAIMGRQSRKRLSFLPYIWMMFSFAATTALVVVFATGTPITGYSAAGYIDLILLALLPQLVGHIIYNFVLRHLSATYTAIVGQFGVIMSIVLAFFIFAEVPAMLQIPGVLAIIVGITLVNLCQHTQTAPLTSQDIVLVELESQVQG